MFTCQKSKYVKVPATEMLAEKYNLGWAVGRIGSFDRAMNTRKDSETGYPIG